MPPCQLIFVFLTEMWFHLIGQAGLELLTSGDLPTLASQSSGNYRHEPPCPALKIFQNEKQTPDVKSLNILSTSSISH